MPVHFKCSVCGGLLKVGSRKIGQSVDCPKCQAKLVVPATDVLSGAAVPAKPPRKAPEKAVAAGAPLESAAEPWNDDEDSETAEVRHPEFIVYDHPADASPVNYEPPPAGAAAAPLAPAPAAPQLSAAPSLSVAPPPTTPASPAAAAGPPSSTAPLIGYAALPAGLNPATAPASTEGVKAAGGSALPPVEAAKSAEGFQPQTSSAPAVRSSVVAPSHMIVLSRTFFGTMVLSLLLLAVFTFFLGVVVGGRYAPPAPSAPPPSPTTPLAAQVLVEGRLIYQPFEGRRSGDAGGVVVALPAAPGAGDALSADVLIPGAADADALREADAALRVRGGALAVCDADGRFLLNLPARGAYRMLCVSNKVARPSPPPAEAAVPLDVFFTKALPRLAKKATRWAPLMADSDHVQVKSVDFGPAER